MRKAWRRAVTFGLLAWLESSPTDQLVVLGGVVAFGVWSWRLHRGGRRC